jgi:hypothetical protein
MGDGLADERLGFSHAGLILGQAIVQVNETAVRECFVGFLAALFRAGNPCSLITRIDGFVE